MHFDLFGGGGGFLNFVKDECWNNMKYEDLESMPL